MIISTKNIFKSCNYFSIIFILFYNISCIADTMPYSVKKIKEETRLNKLPKVNYINLANESIDINKIAKNKILIINFWALWCSPCVKEMPILRDLSNKLIHKDSKILFINQDSFKDYKKVELFIKKLNINKKYVLMDFNMKSNIDFKLRGIPTTLIIDDLGKVQWRIEGVIDWTNKELISWLKKGARKIKY